MRRVTMQGATLAVSLLLLFVITLLGVSTMQSTHMQEKMTANLQDKERSFMAAESALRAGETWLLSLQTQPPVTATCINYPCVQDKYVDVVFETQTEAWWQTRSAAYTSSLEDVATAPRFIVEYLQFIPDTPIVGSNQQNVAGVHYYQVTARGTGADNTAVTVLQTTVARRF